MQTKRFIQTLILFSLLSAYSAVVMPKEESNLTRLLDLVFRRTLGYQIDSKAEFIGTGLTLDRANKARRWLLADWDSIAQEVAKTYKLPSDNQLAEFLRDYQMPDADDMGYVWQWHYKGMPIYLIFHVGSGSGFDVTIVQNTHDITVDEAIIASYYTRLRSFTKPFEVEKWKLDDPDVQYWPDALNHLGAPFFGQATNYKTFSGRIITLPYRYLIANDTEVRVRDGYTEVDFPLPQSFVKELPSSVLEKIVSPDSWVYTDIKVKLTEKGDIDAVVAASLYEGDFYDRLVLFNKPVPSYLVGAGSLPSLDDGWVNE